MTKPKILQDVDDLELGLGSHETDINVHVTQDFKDKLASDNNLLKRELAYLKLKQDANDRIESGVTFGKDYADGAEFNITQKTAKTKSIVPLNAGETILSEGDIGSKVDVIEGQFNVGDEVTVLDDVNSEDVTITRSETLQEVDSNVVEDATVVNSAYNTSGNGGRKLVMLDNGWIIAGVRNGSDLYVYKSEDDGVTWTELTRILNGYTIGDISMVSKGTIVYLLFANADTSPDAIVLTFDATTVPAELNNTSTYSSYFNGLDYNLSMIGNVSITINEAGTELHATWSSKNSTYPNSFNIRYVKGVINADGSVTWDSVEQVTTTNTSGRDHNNPTIIFNDVEAVIISDYKEGSTYFINSFIKSLGTKQYITTANWGNKGVYYGASYTQSSPSAIFVPQSVNGLANGRIWVAWEGTDSADTSAPNIRVSHSDDGGISWSSMQKLTSGNSLPKKNANITVNKNNEVFILFGPQKAVGEFDVRVIKNLDGTWGAESTIKTVSTSSIISPSALFDSTFQIDFSEPLFIYKDATKVGFYGTWHTTVSQYHLECSPLVNSYKTGAWIRESTLNDDGTFSAWDGNYSYTERNNVEVAPNDYDLAGSLGQSLIRLDNGWWVMIAHEMSTATRILKSEDDGATWQQLCYISSYTLAYQYSSIASKGSTLYILGQPFSSGSQVYFWTIDDVELQDNIDISNMNRKILHSGQNGFTYGTDITTNEDKTEIHMVWSCKNDSSPNSYNLHYIQGELLSDGSATFSNPVEDITTINFSGNGVQQPSLVLDSNGTPMVFAKVNGYGSADGISYNSQNSNSTSYKSIGLWKRDVGFGGTAGTSSSWSQKVISNISSNTQHRPDAIRVPSSVSGLEKGRIWVVWHGDDSINSSAHIHCRYSDDDGTTWSSETILTASEDAKGDQVTPSITVNSENEIFVVFVGDADFYKLKMIKNVNDVWQPIEIIREGVDSSVYSISPTAFIDFDMYFTTPVFIYKQGLGGGVYLNGTWRTGELEHLLSTNARFTLQDTSDVVFWLSKDGNFNVDAEVNGEPINGNIYNGEHQLVHTLESASPVELKINLSRNNTNNGKSDKINRILGGVS